MLGVPASRRRRGRQRRRRAGAGAGEPFKIADNSFLVEEAFNQERGHLPEHLRRARGRAATGRRPSRRNGRSSRRRTSSRTRVAVSRWRTTFGFGDMLLNYRYQALEEGPGRPAFSPRVSLDPADRERRNGLGDGSRPAGQPAVQQAARRRLLALERRASPGCRAPRRGPAGDDDRADLLSPFLAGSAIYALRPMFHLMLENVLLFERSFDGIGTVARTRSTRCRRAFAAAGTSATRRSSPARRSRSRGRRRARTPACFCYFSYELPFQKK